MDPVCVAPNDKAEETLSKDDWRIDVTITPPIYTYHSCIRSDTCTPQRGFSVKWQLARAAARQKWRWLSSASFCKSIEQNKLLLKLYIEREIIMPFYSFYCTRYTGVARVHLMKDFCLRGTCVLICRADNSLFPLFCVHIAFRRPCYKIHLTFTHVCGGIWLFVSSNQHF